MLVKNNIKVFIGCGDDITESKFTEKKLSEHQHRKMNNKNSVKNNVKVFIDSGDNLIKNKFTEIMAF